MRAQAPTYRPTWLVLMACIMLMAGGFSLVAGLLKLRDPSVVLTLSNNEPAGSDAELQLNRQLAAARAAAVAPHRTMVRAEAMAEVLLALFTLYATAAVLLRDRNGRALAMGVAAAWIAYQLGTLPVYVSLMRDYAERGAGLLAQVIIQTTGGPGTTDVAEVASRLRSAIVGGPIVMTIISVLGSLVLLAFFGGRRGRALYGIDGPPSTRPET